MTTAELRQKYLDFFKNQGHTILPSASLFPENDPSTLFTGSGMQPMVPYLLGERHPAGDRIVDSQKCFRSQDIEEVGDNRHTTFFEMLGNWSLGSYFKEKQIPWMFQFLTKELGLDPSRLFVTVFRGNDALGIPRDTEAVALWKEAFSSVGISANDKDYSERDGIAEGDRIFYYDEKKNWWSRSGVPDKMPIGEPGGPDTEMFWDFGVEKKFHEQSPFSKEVCHVNCDCGRFMEIGNNVFMEYRKTENGFEKLAQRNVDFGGGLERMLAATENTPDVFLTDAFLPITRFIEEKSGKKYGSDDVTTRAFRIIADHIRAATFLVGDPRGMGPSNVGQGYLIRRLLRRAIREGRRLGIGGAFMVSVADIVITHFSDAYPELITNATRIREEIGREEEKFGKTIEKGIRELEKILVGGTVTGEQAFILFTTYGFPLELTEEVLAEHGHRVDREAFTAEFKKHQELSRSASAGAFKGGLADHSAETTRLHTATHLLHRALRTVLGDHVGQKGSNITAERLRFDFSHTQKMTPEEITAVEKMVNDAIIDDLPMQWVEMTVEEAKASGALGFFEDKYAQIGGKIKVYMAGDDERGFYSKEICGGPHVTHTGELGSFKIEKEEAVAAGIRRIKATVTGLKTA
ncbi:alanine--tRNA ligase [Patescibacteria group bacterium]|nr:alanine--tRNA ligase [Patescibacteria group bacterium]